MQIAQSEWNIRECPSQPGQFSQFSKSFRYNFFYNFVLILCNILFLDFPYQPRTQKNRIDHHCID